LNDLRLLPPLALVAIDDKRRAMDAATECDSVATDSLLVLTECRSALAEAKELKDVLAIRDKAEAIRQLCKVRGASLEAQNEAGEVKLQAERKLGENIAKMNGKGKHGGDRKSSCIVQLEELGIEKTQSHRWQTIASIPAKEFESFIRDAIDSREELTSAAAYRLGKQLARPEPEPIIHATPIVGVTDNLDSLAGQKFGTIYADPPWRYGNVATRANVDRHYAGTMSVAEVCNLPIEQLAADDAHLHLWTTNGFLREAFTVIDSWGFEYRSCFVWVKPQMGIGNYWRVSHEFLLLGIRGDAKRFNEHNHMSWLQADRTKHSAKPDEIRGIIERVSPGPFLELFGRGEVTGWTVFGNQVDAQRRLA
jgi:N6-adenosine-specific RNA methylase IME4